ncbi:STN domain-containing protein [Pseudomonas monteilii]|uniref:STN domain-containing protein n=1 Tax=Pseudomonas monteilii TaxID=76759 RepID=UPI0036E2F368
MLPVHRIQPLALALALSTPFTVTLTRVAQASQTDQAQAFNLAAGPLDMRLTEFAAQSGLYLSAEPHLLSGKRSQALQGRYSAEQALQVLNAPQCQGRLVGSLRHAG